MLNYQRSICLLIAACGLLAGCSGSDDSGDSATAAAQTAAPATPPPIEITPVTMAVTPSDSSSIPAEVLAKLTEIGATTDIPGTSALYAPSFPEGFMADMNVARDVAYGPAERNILDIITAKDMAPNRPVIIFVHGGGFGGGN